MISHHTAEWKFTEVLKRTPAVTNLATLNQIATARIAFALYMYVASMLRCSDVYSHFHTELRHQRFFLNSYSTYQDGCNIKVCRPIDRRPIDRRPIDRRPNDHRISAILIGEW